MLHSDGVVRGAFPFHEGGFHWRCWTSWTSWNIALRWIRAIPVFLDVNSNQWISCIPTFHGQPSVTGKILVRPWGRCWGDWSWGFASVRCFYPRATPILLLLDHLSESADWLQWITKWSIKIYNQNISMHHHICCLIKSLLFIIVNHSNHY